MSDQKKEYVKDDLTVIWKKDLCIHSANCVNGLGVVFNPEKRPWIDLAQAEKQTIIDQIDQCPSGALSYTSVRSELGSDPQGVEVEVIKDGPLAVKSNCMITMANGSKILQEKASYFCRCGSSSNKPFCDGTHKKIKFVD